MVRNAVSAALAFAVVTPLALWLSPQPNWVAVLIAAGAFWRLIAGPLPRIGGILAGASAGLVAALQVAGGVTAWLAVPVTALGLACSYVWSGHVGRFGDRALLAVALATPPIGLANDILFGWQSATMLGRDGVEAAAPSPPAWAIGIVGLALAAGIFRGLWVRR